MVFGAKRPQCHRYKGKSGLILVKGDFQMESYVSVQPHQTLAWSSAKPIGDREPEGLAKVALKGESLKVLPYIGKLPSVDHPKPLLHQHKSSFRRSRSLRNCTVGSGLNYLADSLPCDPKELSNALLREDAVHPVSPDLLLGRKAPEGLIAQP